MNLVCPCCQTIFPIEAGLNDIAGRQAIAEAFRLTPYGDLLLAYIKLFTPAKRALSNQRMVKLLEELLPMIREAKIERGGRIWSAPQEYWKTALAEMLAKRDNGTLTLPLNGHGYLLTIIMGYSSKAEAAQEVKREAAKAGRTPVGHTPSPSASLPPLPPAGEGKGERPRGEMPESVKNYLKKGNRDDHA